MSGSSVIMTMKTSPLFGAVVTGLTGYFVYPYNENIARLSRRWPWLRYVFLFFLIWQGPSANKSITNSLIATAIIYVLVAYAAPAIENI